MGQGLLQLLDARDLALEIALHEIVVGDDDPLDQGVVHGVLPSGHVVGDGAGRGLAPLVGDGRVRQQVGHTPERGLLADGQLERGHARPRRRACRSSRVRSKEARSRSSLLTKIMPGQPQVGGDLPHVGGLHLDPLDRAHHEHRQVGDGQRGGRLFGEVGVAGAVEEVDLVALPLDRGQGGRDRQAALVLLGFEVGDRGGVLDPAGPADGARQIQERFGQGGLAGPAVADQGHVADRRRWVRLHRWSSPGIGSPSPDPGVSRVPPASCSQPSPA